jgi:hypothetical protein
MIDLPGLARAAPFLLLAVALLLIRATLPRLTSRPLHVWREILGTTPFILLYFVARGFAGGRPEEAIAHAQGLIGLERQLGLFHEEALQHGVLTSTLAVDLANWVYIWGHWPVIITTFVWLARTHPNKLPLYRNAMILSGAMGIAVFLLYPVAPPRLVPGLGFIDTVTLRSHSYRVLQPPALEDLYASMPSLHVRWNSLMGAAILREGRRPLLHWCGLLLPAAMFAAVVLTANHYIVDGVAGIAIVTASLGLVSRVQRAHHRAT